MRRIIFKLSEKRNIGLNFSLHTGSSMSLAPGQQMPYALREEDAATSEELQEWYDHRYKAAGLSTRIFDDSKRGSIIKEKENEDCGPAEEHFKETPKVVEVQEAVIPEVSSELNGVSSETLEVSENSLKVSECNEESTSEAQPSVDSTPVEEWDFTRMRDFVKANNIEVVGRGKNDYITAINNFLEG